jgi:hypothetical protein
MRASYRANAARQAVTELMRIKALGGSLPMLPAEPRGQRHDDAINAER